MKTETADLAPRGRRPGSAPPGEWPPERARRGPGRPGAGGTARPPSPPAPAAAERRTQRGTGPGHRRGHRGLPRQEAAHPADSLARLRRLGAAGPRHHPGVARPPGQHDEESALKLKITVDGKVYEVEVEVFEPEPPGPATSRRSGTPASPRPRPPRRRPRPAPAPVADESKVCRSPIAGTVVRSRPGRAGHQGQRRPVGPGSDEDGDGDHGTHRRQGRQDQRQCRRLRAGRTGPRRVRVKIQRLDVARSGRRDNDGLLIIAAALETVEQDHQLVLDRVQALKELVAALMAPEDFDAPLVFAGSGAGQLFRHAVPHPHGRGREDALSAAGGARPEGAALAERLRQEHTSFAAGSPTSATAWRSLSNCRTARPTWSFATC